MFKSKAHIEMGRTLVKQGLMSQETFDKKLAATPEPHNLPEHLNSPQPKTPRVKFVGTVKVIK